MKLAYAAMFALVAAGSVSLIAQAGPRRDGNWDITMEMQMPNMPQGMAMPPIKTTQCITKEEAADPMKGLPSAPQRAGGPPQDCKVTDQKIEGNKVSWAMTCTGAMAMSGTSEILYAGDSFTGNMIMNMGRGGQANTVTMKYTGKRLGDCNK